MDILNEGHILDPFLVSDIGPNTRSKTSSSSDQGIYNWHKSKYLK